MTNPPPPGNWGPPQPDPQPPYGQGQPLYGPPPGQWPAQQGWSQRQPPKNNGLKWLLIGVAVLLVIAITIGATLLFTRDDGDDPPTATGTSSANGDIASADDTGPVGIITEDPTCKQWVSTANSLGDVQRRGWDTRDYSVPASQWTADQLAKHEEVAAAMRAAADHTERLATATPHRIMRELYEQSIVYWRAYADSVPTYTPSDNDLAGAAANASGALVSICDAIAFGSAANGASTAAPIETSATPASIEAPIRLLDSRIAACDELSTLLDTFENETASWRGVDPNVSAVEWSSEQRRVVEGVAEPMTSFADKSLSIADKTNNAVWRDLAALSAVYQRAYVESIKGFVPADYYLIKAATFAIFLVDSACSAAGIG